MLHLLSSFVPYSVKSSSEYNHVFNTGIAFIIFLKQFLQLNFITNSIYNTLLNFVTVIDYWTIFHRNKLTTYYMYLLFYHALLLLAFAMKRQF